MSFLRLIASNNFITVNKDLMRLFGLEEAVILGELAGEYEYWRSQGKLDNGWFYSTVENVEKNTTLSKHKQKKALDTLQKLGVVEVKRKGLPAKRFIKINEQKIFDAVSNKKLKILTSGENLPNKKPIKSTSRAIASKKQLDKNAAVDADLCPTRSKNFNQLEVKNFNLNNNKEKNNNIINNKYIYSSSAKKPIEEVIVNTPISKKEKEITLTNIDQNDASNFTAIEKSSPVDEIVNKSTKNPSTNKLTDKVLTKEFKPIWDIYPKKKGKAKAFELYKKARKNGTTFDEIINGVKKYNEEIRIKRIDPQFIKHGDTWFRNRCWEDEYDTSNGASYDIDEYLKTMDTFAEEKLPGVTYL